MDRRCIMCIQSIINMQIGKYFLPLGSRTLIMGILNITPDSFSDGGQFFDLEKAVNHAQKMVAEGVDIIDVGAESTRPGAIEIGAAEEVSRLIPVVERLVAEVTVPISVDTYKAEVARAALDAGADMINDVWGLQRDLGMAAVAAEYQVPMVIMHNQKRAVYKGDLIQALCRFFKQSIRIAADAGMDKSQVILDPGIGFGKTLEHNLEMLSRIGELSSLGYPLLLGTSRKSVIGSILDLPPGERLEGTIATNVAGIIQGVDIIRVHDVQENRRAACVTDRIFRKK